jgi:hypothetical protein
MSQKNTLKNGLNKDGELNYIKYVIVKNKTIMFKNAAMYKIIGIIIPTILYVTPSSPILLANSTSAKSEYFAVPLSFVVLPFILLWTLFRKKNSTKNSLLFHLVLTIFLSWVGILAVLSAITISTTSILYAAQWMIPYLFIYFYATICTHNDLMNFLQGFIIGTLFSCVYLFAAGVMEFLFVGISTGRITHNVVLQGFHHLYIYVPTAIAFSSLICIGAVRAHVMCIGKFWMVILYVTSFVSLLFTGAREGILVYVLGLLGLFILKNGKTFYLKIFIVLFIVMGLYSNKNFFIEKMDSSEIRTMQKFARLNEEGSGMGGRDVSIATYWKVIEEKPFIGTAMLPATFFPYLGLDTSSSAHNYYIDSFAWGGVFTFILILIMYIYILLQSIVIILRKVKSKMPMDRFQVNMCYLLILYIVVSNNINVPMRQPLTGAIGAFLIFCCFYTGRIGFQNYNEIKESHVIPSNER